MSESSGSAGKRLDRLLPEPLSLWMSVCSLPSLPVFFVSLPFLSLSQSVPTSKMEESPKPAMLGRRCKAQELPLRAGINTGSNYNINMAGNMKPETTNIWRKLQAPELTVNERCFLKEKACCPGNQAALPHPQEMQALEHNMARLERGARSGQGLFLPCDSAVGTPLTYS